MPSRNSLTTADWFGALLLLLSTGSLQAQTCDYSGLTLVARYTLDNLSTDSSGNSHDPVNTPGLAFNGSDKVEGTYSAQYNTAGMQLNDGSFFNDLFITKSLSMFIKPSTLATGQVLYDEGGPNTGGATGISLVLTSTGDLLLTVADRATLRTASFPFPTDGAWHQVGFVYDGATANTVWLYLDGYPVISSAAVDNIRSHSDNGGLLDYFGGLIGGTTGFGPYTGLMDEVTVFDSALTPKNMLDIADSCAVYNHLTALAAMSCSPDAYIVQGAAESDWSTVALHTGAYTSDTDDNGSELNAIGYNRKDNRVWGYDKEDADISHGSLSISIKDGTSGDWITRIVGTITGLENKSDLVVGDVDSNGKLYLAPNSGNVTADIIDVDPASATYMTHIGNLSISWPTGNSSDWAFHPNDGQLYAINDQAGANLLKINPTTGVVTDLGPSGADVDGYGGIFGDVNGFLYAIANSDGDIFRIDLRSDPGADYDESKTLKLATGPSSSNTDGARCVDAGLYMDFGDINATNIDTALADLGPRHAVIGFSAGATNLMIGTGIDVELDVTPDSDATADGADEDGVTFSSSLGDNVTATVVVTNSTGSDATLCSWLDADGDGLLETAERQCSTAANPGGSFNWTLTENGISTHYSRFRLCSLSADCQTTTGVAGLGEVEDYVISYDATSTSITAIRLDGMHTEQILAQLNITSMSSRQVLGLLTMWNPEVAAGMENASHTELAEALRDYLDPDRDDATAVLRWETVAEYGTVGFYAERKDAGDAQWQRLNDNLLPGMIDAPLGGEYMLFDPDALQGNSYLYQIIEQEAWGSMKTYGPFILEQSQMD
jgi:hypothetical protein